MNDLVKRSNLKELRKGFGLRIRELRHSKGMTLEDLEESSGIHWTYIGGIERGERNPSLDAIFVIATGLGVSAQELFRFHRLKSRPSELEKLASELAARLKGLRGNKRNSAIKMFKNLIRELKRI